MIFRSISSYVSGSAKRCAILADIQDGFYNESKKIFKLAETRWLSRQKCVERILENWIALQHYFRLAVFEDKLKSAETILEELNCLKTKAYLEFLSYVLNFFNSFNALFQSKSVLIHLLASKTKVLYFQMLQNFVLPDKITIECDVNDELNLLPLQDIVVGYKTGRVVGSYFILHCKCYFTYLVIILYIVVHAYL